MLLIVWSLIGQSSAMNLCRNYNKFFHQIPSLLKSFLLGDDILKIQFGPCIFYKQYQSHAQSLLALWLLSGWLLTRDTMEIKKFQ